MTIKAHPIFTNFYEISHPLVQHKLSLMRDNNTSKKDFKELVSEISMLLAYEATKDLALTSRAITTPITTCQAPVLLGKKPVILPILRAGLGMVDGFLNLMPSARVGHIGLCRDETTLEPHLYYFKIPASSEQRQFYVCDPMLATGGSIIKTIDVLKGAGVHKIIFICILAAPEGVERLCHAHPDVPIFAAKLDSHLNAQGYICPGLGDAGDRIFGTKCGVIL